MAAGEQQLPSAAVVTEVTNANFEAEVGRVLDAIGQASYVAIDGEFTGLWGSGRDKGHQLDTVGERLGKLASSASKFLIVQYGVATFTWNASAGRYDVAAWSFYVFPRTGRGGAPSAGSVHTIQADSMTFLSDHGFDFNKTFHGGIGYLTPGQEAKAAATIAASDQPRSLVDLEAKPDVKARVGALVAAVREWLDDPTGAADVPAEPEPELEHVLGSTDEPLFTANTAEARGPDVFDTLPVNGFLRRVIHQEMEVAFGDDVRTESVGVDGGPHWKKFVRIVRCDAAAKAKAEAERKAKRVQELSEAVGFRRVLDAIRESGATLVGHNLAYDIVYTMGQFYGVSTTSVAKYKAAVQSQFPSLCDTKLVASHAPAVKPLLESTALEPLLEQLVELAKQSPDGPPVAFHGAAARASDASSASFHDAGYDALVTGMVYGYLMQMLGGADGLAPWLNKINSMRCAVPWFDLTGPHEPAPDNVFVLDGFPSTTRYAQLRSAVAPHKLGACKWLSSTTARVQITPAEGASVLDAAVHIFTTPSAMYTDVKHVSLADPAAPFASLTAPLTAPGSGKRKRDPCDEDDGPSAGAGKRAKPLTSSSSASGCTVM